MSGQDPAAQVDALVATIGPRLDSPGINRRDVVLVTGPWMAGVTAVVAALRERLPQHKFVESADMGPGDAPIAVVFVVSAAAQLTGSDCALLDAAAEHTDVVVGVVSKIDLHRNWREVLAANRDTLAAQRDGALGFRLAPLPQRPAALVAQRVNPRPTAGAFGVAVDALRDRL